MSSDLMPCRWCDDDLFGEPTLLNIHGMAASESEPAYWGHAYEDDSWPCPRKAAEEHALVAKLLAACRLAAPALAEVAKAAHEQAVLSREIEYAEIIAAGARVVQAAIAEA